MAGARASSKAAVPRDAARPVRGTRWLGWLALMGVALGALLLAFQVQRGQAPCGDQFDPPPPNYSADWWRCPREINRHNRVVGKIGSSAINSVVFAADGQRGWAVGTEGTILGTRDSGQRWQPQKNEVRADLTSVAFAADGQRGWAVGEGGTILGTRDGGQSWQPQTSGARTDQIGRAHV